MNYDREETEKNNEEQKDTVYCIVEKGCKQKPILFLEIYV